jgi:mono/diheme cytochrome c family protein
MENDNSKGENKTRDKSRARMAKRNLWAAFAGGIVATLLVLFAVGLVVVYSGGYNVAASEEHRSFVRWALDTNFRRSVENSARGITAPETITREMIAQGGQRYKETCAVCHAGPDGERPEWVGGMRPRPPHLAEAAAEWKINEVFWLAKHGVRLSGMPAFGETHDDRTLWSIAAFVKELPAMTPEEYAATGSPAAPETDNP